MRRAYGTGGCVDVDRRACGNAGEGRGGAVKAVRSPTRAIPLTCVGELHMSGDAKELGAADLGGEASHNPVVDELAVRHFG